MDPTTPEAFQVTERDEAILDHVRRFSISTPEVIRRLYFGETTPNAVTKVTLRLREAGYLRAYDLFEKHIYFVPGPQADPGNERAGEDYGSLRLPKLYGTLAFCCLGEEVRELLTPREWETLRRMLSISPAVSRHDFYLEPLGGDIRLNWIRVDSGVEARHLPQKCRKKVYEWMHDDGFAKLAETGRFGLTVVTGEDRKRDRIQDAFERNPIAGVLARVAVVPHLFELIAYQKVRPQRPSAQQAGGGDDASERLRD